MKTHCRTLFTSLIGIVVGWTACRLNQIQTTAPPMENPMVVKGSLSAARTAAAKPSKGGSNDFSNEAINQTVANICKEPNWLKRYSAFQTLLAEADAASIGKISDAIIACYKQGLNTADLSESLGMREGMLMGAAGMDSLPKLIQSCCGIGM